MRPDRDAIISVIQEKSLKEIRSLPTHKGNKKSCRRHGISITRYKRKRSAVGARGGSVRPDRDATISVIQEKSLKEIRSLPTHKGVRSRARGTGF